ncbi:MAG: hypothetical protein HUJ75_06930 [Parasporobacterium sp.]|nr:hypothetical protein [Parasporobacterium sp.]
MKTLNRNFTKKEKILLLILVIVIIGLVYYQFVYKNINTSIESAKSESVQLEDEKMLVDLKLTKLKQMQEEVEALKAAGETSLMPSYNSNKAEIAMLNTILAGTEDFSFTFSSVTKEGDQIRRPFSLKYTASSYEAAENIVKQLRNSSIRCLILDINMGAVESENIKSSQVSCTINAVFYETMAGGTPDAGLPEEKSSESSTGETY